MREAQKAFEKVNMDNVADWYLLRMLEEVAEEIYSGKIKKIDTRGYENILLETAKRFEKHTQGLPEGIDTPEPLSEDVETLEVTEEKSQEETPESIEARFVSNLEEAFKTNAVKSSPHSYPHLVISNLLVSLKRLEKEQPFDDYDPDENCPYGLVIVSTLSFKDSIIIPGMELPKPTLFLKAMHCESLDDASELIQAIKPTKKLSATAGIKDHNLAYMVVDHRIARNITHERIALIRRNLYDV